MNIHPVPVTEQGRVSKYQKARFLFMFYLLGTMFWFLSVYFSAMSTFQYLQSRAFYYEWFICSGANPVTTYGLSPQWLKGETSSIVTDVINIEVLKLNGHS